MFSMHIYKKHSMIYYDEFSYLKTDDYDKIIENAFMLKEV